MSLDLIPEGLVPTLGAQGPHTDTAGLAIRELRPDEHGLDQRPSFLPGHRVDVLVGPVLDGVQPDLDLHHGSPAVLGLGADGLRRGVAVQLRVHPRKLLLKVRDVALGPLQLRRGFLLGDSLLTDQGEDPLASILEFL